MLIVMAGLPASGKSALAETLARALRCAVLSVDPIEAALWRAGIARTEPTGLAAYVVAEDLAREQLLLGHDVIIDAVNDAAEARQQWRSLASTAEVPIAFLEVHCSDPVVHEQRLRSRRREIPGFSEPTWQEVRDREPALRSWTGRRLRLDSVRPIPDLLGAALTYLDDVRTTAPPA